MSLLTHAPTVAPASVEDVLAIAHALEREATARYADLAQCMRRVSHDEVAAVFEALAAEEQHHVDQVAQLSQHLLHRPPDPAVVRWELPDTFDADEAAGLAHLTPYKALSIAVRNEERTFAFWSYVAADAAEPQVRAQAEAMARQELLHAAKLRHERRRAYHAERAAGTPVADVAVPPTAAAARSEAIRLESQAAGFLDGAADRLDRLGDGASARLLREVAAAMRASLPSGAAPPPDAAEAAAIVRAVHGFAAAGRAALLFEAAGVVERLLMIYLGWLDARADPALAELLRPIADATTERLILINARLGVVEPSLQSSALRAASAVSRTAVEGV